MQTMFTCPGVLSNDHHFTCAISLTCKHVEPSRKEKKVNERKEDKNKLTVKEKRKEGEGKKGGE